MVGNGKNGHGKCVGCFFWEWSCWDHLQLGSETLMLIFFGGGKGKKGVFEEMGMVSNIVCCECWMPKTVTLDVFEADGSVGFFIHSFCCKGAFFVRRIGNVYIYIYTYTYTSDHVIPARNGWMV